MNSDGPEKNLAVAFAEESRNAARAEVFAQKATREDKEDLARLLRAVADSRRVHSSRLLMLLRGKIGAAWEEVERQCIEESKAALKLYEQLMADESSGAMAQKTYDQFRGVEERNLAAFTAAAKGRDVAQEFWVCQVCGHLAEDHPPESCPVCGAITQKFNRVE